MVALAFVAGAALFDAILRSQAVTALGPAVFRLLNRVFSPQFFVLLVATWAIAGSLLLLNRREELVLGLLLFGSTLANVLVYPVIDAHWGVFSVLLFLLAFIATAFPHSRGRDSGRRF